MEKQSTKTASSRFKRLSMAVACIMVYGPLAWLCYYDWEIGVPVFLMIVGNNIFLQVREMP